MGAISRGRHNVLPGATVFGMIGYVGQRSYAGLDSLRSKGHVAPNDASSQWTRSLWQQIPSARWTFLKALSDDDYKRLLANKILVIDSELVSIEENIQTFRSQRAKTILPRIAEREDGEHT